MRAAKSDRDRDSVDSALSEIDLLAQERVALEFLSHAIDGEAGKAVADIQQIGDARG
jgi:hypothetical protein